MPDPFHSRIRSALKNPNLQAALDDNAERRRQARQQAFCDLPDAEALRRRAHAVRAETIAGLDRYLEQFVANVSAHGITVHRAADASQAIQIILEIASQRQARRIAKSKTMLSEEIELNPALEKAGLEVVETDLGEYIVQLRGERPGHLITPAVHLRRQDVGQTFHEKLGIPYTDDIPSLTAEARTRLRQVFLDADIGLSGVNLGVAETGAICLLTNEGNGRLVSTLPPVHIALMGMERLVPTLDDLALMLSLLPRSSTGQKMTVYTSLIHKPRQPDEVDGAIERHLVLLDNGRSAIRQSPLAEALYCIRCGACLNACPVFREIGGHAYVGKHGEASIYAGPIGSVLSPALFGQAEFGNLARASTLCGACREVCPVDIDLPRLLLRVRAGGMQIETPQAPPAAAASLKWSLRLYTWIATSPRRFAAAQRIAAAASRILAPLSPWMRLPAFTGWGFSKDLPRPASRSFRSRWKDRKEIIRSAILAQNNPAKDRTESSHPEQVFKNESPASPSRVDAFSRELESLGGRMIPCEAGALADTVIRFLNERQIDAVQAWDDACLPDGLLEAMRAAGIRVTGEPDPEIKAGITAAPAAIAETGTLVLPGGPGQPLTASLLPRIHLAVLRQENIYETLAQALSLRVVQEASTTVLISGPSRTADIEMSLTIGMHGPAEVVVFLLL